jgi:hypothetical protein
VMIKRRLVLPEGRRREISFDEESTRGGCDERRGGRGGRCCWLISCNEDAWRSEDGIMTRH